MVAGICNSVGGSILFDMPRTSIICPVPFPSRLITTHTLTATTFVNNTLHDVASVGRATDRRDGRLVQQHISQLFALVVLCTKYVAATPL